MQNENKTSVQDLSPQDQARHTQIETKVRELHAQIGQDYDNNGERVAAGLLERYKAAGLKGDVSGVYLSQANAYVKQGENIIGVVGDRENPTSQTFHGKSSDLIATPAQDSFSRVLDHDRNQQMTQNQEQTLQRNRTQEEATQGTPAMGARSTFS